MSRKAFTDTLEGFIQKFVKSCSEYDLDTNSGGLSHPNKGHPFVGDFVNIFPGGAGREGQEAIVGVLEELIEKHPSLKGNVELRRSRVDNSVDIHIRGDGRGEFTNQFTQLLNDAMKKEMGNPEISARNINKQDCLASNFGREAIGADTVDVARTTITNPALTSKGLIVG